MVTIGDAEQAVSTELCGGTHVECTSVLHPFHIISEGAVGTGVRCTVLEVHADSLNECRFRRIEAVAGRAATSWLQSQQQTLQQMAQVLGVSSVQVSRHCDPRSCDASV